jgi:hypothetical protein
MFSLLRQAAYNEQENTIAQDVIDAYEGAGGDSTNKALLFDKATELLTKILQSGVNLRIMIDALDECSDPYGLLEALRDAAATAVRNSYPRQGRLELLVSSRQNIEVLKYMKNAVPIDINVAKDEYDMKVYIITEVRNRKEQERLLEGKYEDLENELIEVLHEKAGGM